MDTSQYLLTTLTRMLAARSLDGDAWHDPQRRRRKLLPSRRIDR